MKLLTKELRALLPALRSQEHVADPIVQCKFFTPWAGWTWYILEAGDEEGDTMLFAWVVGMEKELGYVLLSELEQVRGPGGLRVERDLYFTPKPLSEIMKIGGNS